MHLLRLINVNISNSIKKEKHKPTVVIPQTPTHLCQTNMHVLMFLLYFHVLHLFSLFPILLFFIFTSCILLAFSFPLVHSCHPPLLYLRYQSVFHLLRITLSRSHLAALCSCAAAAAARGCRPLLFITGRARGQRGHGAH